jgi:phosphoglycerate dehydrogenase-like enzyme
VWVPAGFARGGLPSDVELCPWFEQPAGVELVVPRWGDAEVLAALAGLPDLRVVQVLSAGYEWIAGSIPEGVTLCNAGDTRSPAVAQWVLGVILADAIGLERGVRQRGAQRWDHWRPAELAGRTVLIVGHGSIGRAVERRLAPFGVRVARVARRARSGVASAEDLPELAADADVVVVLAALTPQTRGMVGREVIARMKVGALLVNAARGPVVDTEALVDALRAGRIRAALDVTDPEPLPPGHPLWTLDGVLLTPHNSGDSDRAEAAAEALARAQILRYRAGLALEHVISGPLTSERRGAP